MSVTTEPFMVECTSVAQANAIDTTKYRLSEKLSEHGIFIFLKRGGGKTKQE